MCQNALALFSNGGLFQAALLRLACFNAGNVVALSEHDHQEEVPDVLHCTTSIIASAAVKLGV